MVPGDLPAASDDITELLAAWTDDHAARAALMPRLYEELRRLAHHYMRGERQNHTLQTTALVNEVYLKLAGLTRVDWRDRAHFMATVATLMRRILVDYARAHRSDKRGGDVSITSLDDQDRAVGGVDVDVLALDEALTRLAALDPQPGRVVELRFFGGLNVDETAETLGISPRTVKREWAIAKAWLHHQLASLP